MTSVDHAQDEKRPGCGYIRVSSDKQECARQEQSIPARHATLPDGLSENGIDLFYDEGISAWSGKHRPGFEEMLESIRRGERSFLIIDTSSRLTRQGIRAALQIFWTLEDVNCRLFTTEGKEYRFNDLGGIISLAVEAEGDQRFSDKRSHDISTGKAAKAKAGKWHHGDASPGYRFNKETGELEATDDLALIREAGDRFLARETYKQICDFLSATLSEEALVRRKNSRAYVSRDRLRGWLSNPVYAGYIVRHRGLETEELHQGSHPSVWSIEKFEAIQRLLAAKREKNAARQPRTWAFSGIAKCPTCGHAQRLHPVSNHGRSYVYIRCAGDDCPERSRLPIAAAYEANILSGLAAIAYAIDDLLATDPAWGEPKKHKEENPDEIRAARDAAQAELAAIQKELILSPSLRDDPEIQTKRQQVLQRRDGHAAHLDRLVNQAKSHREQLRTLADSILSLGALAKPDPWAGFIAEETLTLIDEKHGRGEPDERTITINQEGRTRPTMIQLLEGWRLADFDQRCAAIRPALEAVYAGRETVEYRFRGLTSPISINAAFESKRGAPVKALEEDGFGLTHVGSIRAPARSGARPPAARPPVTRPSASARATR